MTTEISFRQVRDSTVQQHECDRHGQMLGVLDTFQHLDPPTAQEVIARLSPSQLSALANDVDADGCFGVQGLGPDDKKALFDCFARQLTGALLAKAMTAFDTPEDTEMLSSAVATHADPDVVRDCLLSMNTQAMRFALDESDVTGTPPISEISTPASSRATAVLLAALTKSPRHFDEAVLELGNRGVLPATLLAAEDRKATSLHLFGRRLTWNQTATQVDTLRAVLSGGIQSQNPGAVCALARASVDHRRAQASLELPQAVEAARVLNPGIAALLRHARQMDGDCAVTIARPREAVPSPFPP
jgi:hypothetical protein